MAYNMNQNIPLQDLLENLAQNKINRILGNNINSAGQPPQTGLGGIMQQLNGQQQPGQQSSVQQNLQQLAPQQQIQQYQQQQQMAAQRQQQAAQQQRGFNPAGKYNPYNPLNIEEKAVENANKDIEREEDTVNKAAREERKKAAKEKTREQLAKQPKLTAKQKEAESKYVERLSALNEGAEDSDKRLNKMEKLIEKGNLPNATFYTLFKTLEDSVNPAHAAAAGAGIGAYAGGPVGAAIGASIGGLIQPVATLLRGVHKQFAPDTEEFEKLSNDFVKNAKAIFGSRLTDADLKAFLSTVPTLSQTDQGKTQIIKNMKNFNQAAKIRYKTMREIIRENDNKIPANLELLVTDRAKDELDDLAKQFVA